MIDVAIFSYNRPAYLKNCVDSVQRNLPGATIRIFDDRSDDPQLVAYLASLGDMVADTGQSGAGRHGGLYPNMQRAFETSMAEYLLMLQDDVQVVRSVDARDLADISGIFASDPEVAFLSVLFMRGQTMRRYRRQLVVQSGRGAYDSPADAPPESRAHRQAYFDISLWHVARLRDAGWQVQPSEIENIRQARRLFSGMPTLKNPFVFFCPEVPFYRNRAQTWAARIARRVSGDHVKAFHDMATADTARFRDRDMAAWPVAEDWLKPQDRRVRKPFVYKDVKARWWLNLIYVVERLFRK